MSISRRNFALGLVALLIPVTASAHRSKRKHRHKYPLRPAARRRFRRRVGWRMVAGRRRLVVPLALAVGWELVVDNRVAVVREIHTHHIVVEHSDGSRESIDSLSEDTNQNSEQYTG